MNIVVNGEQYDVPEGSSVASLLEQFGLLDERVAVERNSEIVKKDGYSTASLEEGDTIEVVRFVGGG